MVVPHAEHLRHTVLIVDDDPHILATLEDLMVGDGHNVLKARDGDEALTIAKMVSPCVVLSDVHMPGLDGLELCRALKDSTATSHIPVILITGRVADEDVAAAIEAGAVDYIKKPFDRAETTMRVRSTIRFHRLLKTKERSDKQLRAISDTSRDAIIIMNGSGEVAHWSQAATTIFGYAQREALGRSLHALIVPDRLRDQRQRQALATFMRTGGGPVLGKTLELTARAKDGREFPVELAVSATQIAGQWFAVGFVHDSTKRKRAEALHRMVFESSRDATTTIAPPSWRYTSGNIMAITVFGATSEQHLCELGPWDVSPERQPDGRLSSEKAAEMIETAMREGSHFFEWTHKKLGGDTFPTNVKLTRFDLDGEPLLQATVRDLTEQKALEVQLRQTQKLEAIGQLAAGIAHEINTPTQYVSDNVAFLTKAFDNVVGALETCREALFDEASAVPPETLKAVRRSLRKAKVDFLREEIPDALEQSKDGLHRIARIVGAMKEFSHPSRGQMQPVDLHQALETTITVARNEWKYVATVETDFDDALEPIPVLRDELNQVFLNIIVNASHAISDATDKGANGLGTITIATHRSGDRVEIRIGDSGTGIPEAIRSKVFEPFFTTKALGKGTGQGLAIAHSVVVDKHGGTIDIESELGVGTTFVITLPIESEEACQGATVPRECAA